VTRPVEGFRSDELRAALVEALAGRPAALEKLLATAGLVRGVKPSLGLAVAFGAEVANLSGELAPLLNRLANDDAPPDSPRVYLPIVAAHGWAARVRAGREVEAGWAALGELAADYRGAVRIATLDALTTLCMRDGGADLLLARALSWLEHEDREQRLASAALVLEALSDRQVLAALSDTEALLAYLAQLIADIADAPRAAERWESRRRALRSLPLALARAVSFLRGGERGLQWFEAQCAEATHPDLREALSRAIALLRSDEHALGERMVASARAALEASAKPLRDPSRLRPGTGRGKGSRRTR
jgi:hypothetical protein